MARSPDPRAATRASWLALPPEPWKNGGGVTRTLAADPAGRWRVSIADIDRAGPYSRFPGYDRVSVVLSGQGVALQGEAGAVALRPREPTGFAGDEVLQSRLVEGPVRVLNLFVLRGAAEARVMCLDVAGSACRAGSLPDQGARRVARLVVAVDAGRYPGASAGEHWELAAGEFALGEREVDAGTVPATDVATLGARAEDASGSVPDPGFAVSLDIDVLAPG